MINKKASVLLIVLIILASALAIALTLSEKNTQSYAEAVTLKNLIQANIIASTAANSVSEILKEDNNDSDSSEDVWAYPLSYPKDNMNITLQLAPLNSKIDFNILHNSDNKTKDRIINSFDKISEDKNIEIEYLEKIADYIDNDTIPMNFGNEYNLIMYNGREINIKNKPLDTLYETFIILDNSSYATIKKLFTAGIGEKKININFASNDVITYYLPEIKDFAEDIIKYRQNNIYNDISEIRKAAAIPNEVYQKIINYITVKSENFYLRINIAISDNLFYYHALINKKDGIKLFFKGLNEDYF